MPTLLERSQVLRAQIGRLSAAASEKARFDRLTTRAGQIREARDQLEAARTAVRILEARGLRPADLPRPSAALRRKAPALRANLAADWRAFADDSSVANTLIEPVKTHASRMNDAALTVWRAHVDAGLPNIRDALITALSAAGFRSQCAQLEQLRNEIAALKRACPTKMTDFVRLDEVKVAIQAIWSELDGVPVDVQNFLRKAAQRNATIADLTPGIRAWLSDHGMLGQLRIGLG